MAARGKPPHPAALSQRQIRPGRALCVLPRLWAKLCVRDARFHHTPFVSNAKTVCCTEGCASTTNRACPRTVLLPSDNQDAFMHTTYFRNIPFIC